MSETSSRLTQAEIDKLALDQRMRAINNTDAEGNPKDGIEHSDDVAQVAGKMAVTEFLQPQAPQFGDDDTEDFMRAQLDGGIYKYD